MRQFKKRWIMYFILFMVLSAATFFVACENPKAIDKSTSSSENDDKMGEAFGKFIQSFSPNFIGSEGMFVPNGSSISLVNGDSSTFIIDPSDDYEYVGRNENGSIFRLIGDNKTTITCTCNSTGSCSPFTYGDIYACGSKDCTDCTMKVTKGTSDDKIFSGGILKNLLQLLLLSSYKLTRICLVLLTLCLKL